MNLDKTFVFTDFDLDGTVSLLQLHWVLNAKPGQLKFKSTTVSNFRREYLNWLNENKPTDYEKIYILDLDVSNSIDLIDLKNVVIIDHHLTHVKAAEQYKNATIHITETTSCAKQLYKALKPANLNVSQKTMIAIADDFDSYTLAIPQSYEMNCLLTNMQKAEGVQKAERFMKRFYTGFAGFNTQEAALIKEHVERKNKAIRELEIYEGKISVGGKERYVLGTTGNKFVNEICEHLIKKLGAEIAFFVNPDASHVSFRKGKTCDVDVSKLAAKLCEGGGHEYAAGGKITESFMNFTKLLTPAVKQCPE